MASTRKRKNSPGSSQERAPAGIVQSRAEFLADARTVFDSLTRPLFGARMPETSGREFARRYTRAVDAVVGLIFQRAAHRHGLASDTADIAVIAMGGYGRQELAPYSDVDILVLCAKKTPQAEAVAGSFTRLLWDFGFEPGHAMESLISIESDAERDIDTKTALIESRWVCGSRKVARGLERHARRIRRADREMYLRRKVADAMARRQKHGNSWQLIEPNVKLSPGGMRDFHTLDWLGQVGRFHRGLVALEKKGLLLRGERGELEAAYDFLLRVRIEMHIVTASRQDQLTVELQRKMAKALDFVDRGGHLAVEHFMRTYYTHTRTIARITEDCLDALDYGDNVGVMVGHSRLTRDGSTINVPLRREAMIRDPLRVFKLQKQTGRKLDRGLRRRLLRALHEYLGGATVLRRMRKSFLEILEDDDNAATVVRSMHDTLFLMRLIPEYDRLTCLKRYDLYHHFTVDEHSFRVLEYLTALGDDPDSRDPLVRLYSEIGDKRLLFLSALLHDIGKIEGRGHAKKGAVMSREILGRFGMPEHEIEFVCFLVEQHLIMSHYSQRRDPSDLGTISAFCDLAQDRTRLKYLCLLTYADYRATAPEVWNDWKRTLLWELYVRASDFMAAREKQPEAVYKQQKDMLLSGFAEGEERSAALAHIDLLPGGYLLNMPEEVVREHMMMVRSLQRVSFSVSYRRTGEAHEITFVTPDTPFRLSQLCGALTVSDFNILHAFAFTRKDGIVIDVFRVSDIRGELDDVTDDAQAAAHAVDERMEVLRRSFAGVLDGAINLDVATKEHATRWRRRRRQTEIPIDVKVKFENDVSPDFTIIDVFAADRPGLLYRITRALSHEGLTIFRANISTEATRAIDAFYVTDEAGKKITSASRLERTRDALEGEVGGE